jgi:(p)ppGpp synthase/HD superfamily hydrolase
MPHYAQTHLQLYRQLQDAGYSQEDLVLVDRAYQIAMRLFAAHYRPNNKPFLIHLVGVASILANVRQPAVVVAAGLLHSAYPLGLGRNGNEVNPKYRKQIAASLGPEIEQLVFEYANRRWSVADFRGGKDKDKDKDKDDVQSLPVNSRQLYLIKLADIHEEFLDAGHLYQPRKKLLWDEDINQPWLHEVANRIESLGYESWAQEFRLAVDSNKGILPDAIRGKANSSYIVAPGLLPDNHLKNRLIRWLVRH